MNSITETKYSKHHQVLIESAKQYKRDYIQNRRLH